MELQKSLDRDWYLKDWMNLKGFSQTQMAMRAGWSNAKMSEMYNGKFQYKRDTVNQISKILGIEPFELLIPPELAEGLHLVLDGVRSLDAGLMSKQMDL